MTALGPLSHFSDPEDQKADVDIDSKRALKGVAIGFVVAFVVVSVLTAIAVIAFMAGS